MRKKIILALLLMITGVAIAAKIAMGVGNDSHDNTSRIRITYDIPVAGFAYYDGGNIEDVGY